MKTQVLSAFDRDDVSGLSVKLSGAEYMLSIQGGTRDDAANSHTNDALDEVHAPASPSLSKATLDPLRLGALVTNVRLCALFLCTQESERERQRERRERERERGSVREREPTCTHVHTHTTGAERVPAWLLAPECIADKSVSQQSDIWAFGVLAWQLYAYASSAPLPPPAPYTDKGAES